MQQTGLSRRKFLQFSASALGVAALAACAPPPAGAPAASGGQAAAPAGEKIVLTFGHHWEAAFRPTQDTFDKKYIEQHPNIDLQSTYNTWSDHNNIVPTWAAANQLPDVIYVHGSRSYPWAFEGIIISIQDQVDKDEAFNVKGIWEESLRLYRFKGNLVGIPYDHGAIILGYNKDIFDAAGEAYPDDTWNMDKLREVALKLTKTDGDQPQWGWSGGFPDFGNGGNDCMLRPWGAQEMNAEEDKLMLDTPEAAAAVQFWYDMTHTDKSSPTPSQSQAFEQGAFIAGRVAMDTVASWSTPTLKQFASFNWDVAAWPGATAKGCGAFGSGFSVTRDSKHPNEAWEYLSAYLSKDGMEEMWGRSGRGSPARKDAYESWMKSASAPANAQAYLTALDSYAVTSSPFQTLAAAEINDICSRQATLLRNGEAQVADALATIMKEGQPVLEAAAARAKG